MKQFLSIIFVLAITGLYSCQKEVSVEGGVVTGGGNTNSGTSAGSLGGTPGACASALVTGVFGQGLPLTDSTNFLTVQVTITTPGTYTIGTDTVNGVYFLKSGTFTDSGIQFVNLRAYGTPSNPGLFTNTVKYKGTSCSFEVEVFAQAITNGPDYFPTTAASNWTYNNDLAIPPVPDTFRTTSTGTTKDFAGNTYAAFVTTPVIDSAFYRKASGIYYEYFDGLTFPLPGGNATISGEYIFLKDNVAVNTEWESPEFPVTYMGVAAKIKLKLTILEKNSTKLIGNKVYANVIVVKRDIQAAVGPTYQSIDVSERWYAKGIGLINDNGTTQPYTNDVISYKVF